MLDVFNISGIFFFKATEVYWIDCKEAAGRAVEEKLSAIPDVLENTVFLKNFVCCCNI